TDLTRDARREVAGLNERVLARTPAARWGDPKDFAGIAVFLASAASDFVTGAAMRLFRAGLAGRAAAHTPMPVLFAPQATCGTSQCNLSFRVKTGNRGAFDLRCAAV